MMEPMEDLNPIRADKVAQTLIDGVRRSPLYRGEMAAAVIISTKGHEYIEDFYRRHGNWGPEAFVEGHRILHIHDLPLVLVDCLDDDEFHVIDDHHYQWAIRVGLVLTEERAKRAGVDV